MEPRITSLQNDRVKQAARLRESSERRAQGRMLIDGIREIERARLGRIELLEVFFCDELLTDTEGRRILDELGRTSTELISVSPAVLEKIAYGQRTAGLVAVAKVPKKSLEDIRLPECPLVCVLEGVEKPGNVGAVVRSADAVGASAVVVADGPGDLFNPNAIRASLGLVFTMPGSFATGDEVRHWLLDKSLVIYAARVDGSVPYTAVDFRQPCAIVLGSEAQGLSDKWNGLGIVNISLPMVGQGDSLNVSATAAVLLYEALRQRGAKK